MEPDKPEYIDCLPSYNSASGKYFQVRWPDKKKSSHRMIAVNFNKCGTEACAKRISHQILDKLAAGKAVKADLPALLAKLMDDSL